MAMYGSPNPGTGNPNYCAICLNPFQDPRIVGGCLHSFCLQCLKGYVGQLQGSRTFLCPLCRQECVVPKEGVESLGVDVLDSQQGCEKLSGTQDTAEVSTVGQNPGRVEGTMASMSNQLKKLTITPAVSKSNEPPCSVCNNVGSSRFCKNCHDIYLCETCAKAHGSKPITRGHKLLEVCSQHGRPAEFYCKNCKHAACSVCLIAMHSGEHHVVVSIFEIFTSVLDSLKGLRGDVNTTLTAVDKCRKTMVEIDSRMKETCTAELAKKESATKKKTAEEQQELLQVQHEVKLTRQKLDGLVKQETKLKERQKKTAQDAKTEIDEYKAAVACRATKVTRLIRELDDVKGKLSDRFSQGLLNVTSFTAKKLCHLQATATGVRGIMTTANKAANEAEKTKLNLEPFLKTLYSFHKRHSNNLILSEGDKVVSWRPTNVNPNQQMVFNPGVQAQQFGATGWNSQMMWGGECGGWPAQQDQSERGACGVAMINQRITHGDVVDIQIVRAQPNFATVYYNKHFYAGFTHLEPELVDVNDVGWTQNLGPLEGYIGCEYVGDFSRMSFYDMALCDFTDVLGNYAGVQLTLHISRPDDVSAVVSIQALSGGRGRETIAQRIYRQQHVNQPRNRHDLYLCLIFGQDCITKLTIVPEEERKANITQDFNTQVAQLYVSSALDQMSRGATWN